MRRVLAWELFLKLGFEYRHDAKKHVILTGRQLGGAFVRCAEGYLSPRDVHSAELAVDVGGATGRVEVTAALGMCDCDECQAGNEDEAAVHD